jgi:hypothetical protein
LAAIVQRVVFAPNFKTQWLSPERVWADERKLALEFPTYEEADAEVAILRMEGEEHAHAAIGEKPTKRAPEFDPLTPAPAPIRRERKPKSTVKPGRRLWWKEHEAYS